MTVARTYLDFSPAEVLDVDVGTADGLEKFGQALRGSVADRAVVVVRMCGEPLCAATVSTTELSQRPDALLGLIRSQTRLAESHHRHGPLAGGERCRWRERLLDGAYKPEPVTLAICTRGRPERLRETLESVTRLDYPSFELLLVDNAPDSDVNRVVLEEFGDRVEARYVVEPVPGLSRARNTAVRHSRHGIIAFTDDDVRLDQSWLWGIEFGFRLGRRVGVVSGPVLPAEIRSQAQDLFERQGGHSKARGFRRQLLGIDCGAQSPYFPLPPFAVGCNMAVRREALAEIGGFDEALGAGTAARAAEDTAAVTELLLRGWRCSYEPSALIWHYHRETLEELNAQRYAYGLGLGAYYTSLVARDPRRIWPLLKLAPTALRAITQPDPLGTDATNSRNSSAVDRGGLARGPSAYVRGRIGAASSRPHAVPPRFPVGRARAERRP